MPGPCYLFCLCSSILNRVKVCLILAILSPPTNDRVRKLEPPRLNTNFLANLSAIEGTFQIFTCSVISGAEPIFFTYHFNGRPISESSDIKIESSAKFSFLTLQHIKQSDSGSYTCQAKNQYGLNSVTWNLFVNGNHIYVSL